MINSKTKLLPDHTYHIYSRANGQEILFATYENYRYFLTKYKQYIIPIADSYCLMPNHFHFLIRFKGEEDINKISEKRVEDYSNFLSGKFQDFLNSYAKAFNKQKGRKGSLFMHPFKRKNINDSKYLRKVIHYIHYNPIAVELCRAPSEWYYSSFNAIVSKSDSLIERNVVIGLFEDVENFIYVHQNIPELTGNIISVEDC